MRKVLNTTTGIEYELPEAPEEVTLSQWMRLVKTVEEDGDELDATAALLGIERGEAEHITAYGYTVMNARPDILAASIGSGKKRDTLTIFDEAVKVPKSWEACTLGQRAMVLAFIKEQKFYEVADKVLAVCMAPVVYGDHWSEHIDDLASECAELSAVDAVPTAGFFLARLLNTSGAITTPLASPLLAISSRQGAGSWTASAFLTLWTHSLAAALSDGKKQ